MLSCDIMRILLDCQYTASVKLTLITLARYVDDEGRCFPSISTLSKRSGLARRTVIRSLNEAVSLGCIERMQSKGRSTTYQFINLEESIMNGDTTSDQCHSGTLSSIHKGEVSNSNSDNVISLSNNGILAQVTSNPERALMDAFILFWDAFPRKKGKLAAIKAFKAAAKLEEPHIIIQAARNFAHDSRHTERRYIPHPATWLNQGRWDDEPDEEQSNTSKLDNLLSIVPTPLENKL